MDEVEDLYDEFGNYIGGGSDLGEEEAFERIEEEYIEEPEYTNDSHVNGQPAYQERQVVLHEDKKYYPSALEVYGAGIEVSVQDEDTQMLSEPIIAPIKQVQITHQEAGIPEMKHAPTLEYFHHLSGLRGRRRNVAFVGHIHHGKTSLIDCLVAAAHVNAPKRPRIHLKNSKTRCRTARYLDSLLQERERGISLQMKPCSLPVHVPSQQATFMLNVLDTPGHPDFRCDVAVALGVGCDGVVLVVDAVEGVLAGGEAALKAALAAERPILLVLNKIERLWLELKLAPLDAYYKLKHTIDSLNTIAGRCLFAPELGNVVFASDEGGYAFTLESFCRSQYTHVGDSAAFARRLWGDVFFNGKQFTKSPSDKRTFVALVLEPLYKLYTAVLSSPDLEQLQVFLSQSLGINMKLSQLQRYPTPDSLLSPILARFFTKSAHGSTPCDGLIDAIVRVTPAETEDIDNSATILSICKVYPPASIKFKSAADTQSQIEAAPRLLCRLVSGSVWAGMELSFSSSEDTRVSIKPTSIVISCTRYEVPIDGPTSAAFVLLSGIPLDRIPKRGILSNRTQASSHTSGLDTIERLWKLPNSSLLRVSIEPLQPSELPRMLQSLRLLSCLYPALKTHVEENGEHVLMMPGELYADCILHDLRHFTGGTSAQAAHTSLAIRVSDPSVSFAESVQEISTVKCFADTMNGKLRISMLAEPFESGLAEWLDSCDFSTMAAPERNSVLVGKFGWDRVSVKGILGVAGACFLIDDTFGGVPADLLAALKPSLLQGFQWAVREGPLCEAQIRGVKFRLTGLDLLGSNVSPAMLSPAQVVPAARRACYSAFLTASPRLLEPVMGVQIIAPGECIEAIYGCLARRRGHVLSDTPLPAAPLYTINALLPLLDGAGFEVDLRVATMGSAFSVASFDHWQMLPGDPLDTKIGPSLLEPAPAPALARDCLLKVRKRRGLSDDVRIDKFFDYEMRQVLKEAKIL